MTLIRPDSPGTSDYGQDSQKADDLVREVIRDIAKNKQKAVELSRVELESLSPAVRSQLAKMLSEQL